MNKELLIFGANSPLGKGITRILSQKNFNKIYLFDRRDNEVEYEKKNMEKFITGDLSEEENVKKAFQNISASKDKLFFLYSAIGGFTGGKTIWETDTEEFNRMININIKSAFLLAKYFSLLVKESAGGSICFTSAMVGLNPELKKGVYGLSKRALLHLVETLTLEGKEINLSVNAIAPYIIDTPENRKWIKGSHDNWFKPEEIGELSFMLFENYKIISGNIIRLKQRLK